MSERSALLVGATGLVGGHLLDLLLAEPAYGRVTVLARRPRPDRLAGQGKLDWHEVDLGDLGETAAWRAHVRADDLFICLGTTIRQAGSQQAFRRVDLEMPLAIARAAKAAGVSHVAVVSSMGADPESRIFYSRTKGQLEVELRALELPSLALLRPSLLLGQRETPRLGERVSAFFLGGLRPILRGPLARLRAVPGATVARALLASALAPAPGTVVIENTELFGLAPPR